MQTLLIRKPTLRSKLQAFFSDYWLACAVLHRQADLEQLLRWTTRKRLSKPQAHYKRLLIDVDGLLWKYQRRSALAVTVARYAVQLSTWIAPTPKSSYRKGYAARYL